MKKAGAASEKERFRLGLFLSNYMTGRKYGNGR